MKVSDAISMLRHQILLPSVTTMGQCSQQCGRVSRGGGMCATCIVDEFDGTPIAPMLDAYAQTLRAQQHANYAAESIAEMALRHDK